MILLVNDKEVLEKYNEIWNKIKKLFGKEFDSKPVYNYKYIKAKINLYKTNFPGNITSIIHAFLQYCYILLLMQIKNITRKYS